MQFTLNGNKNTYDGEQNLTLLAYLREIAGIISPKDGCSCQAACGCCTVEMNGKAVLSCVTKMKDVANGNVVTIEGIGDYKQRVFAEAFVEKGGCQCGFCIPGIVMRAKVLLDHNPSPTRADVVQALQMHLCRCTGYHKIVEAILYAAEALRAGREILPKEASGKIGTRHPKYQAHQVVLGQQPYLRDMKMPGMLYGALKFSDHPRAKVIEIDMSKAERMPGVKRVFIAKDIPGDRYTGLLVSDWPVIVAAGETTHYVGDVLAGVVAESENEARAAVAQIAVEYEVLEPVTDVFEAMKDSAPTLHPNGNVLEVCHMTRGDAEQTLAASVYVVHGVYETPLIEHAFLEAECCIVRPWLDPGKEGGIEVFSQSQGVYEEQRFLAKILGLPLDKVRVRQVATGGGFGGKEDLSVQGHAALFAYHLKTPVKVMLTRDESIRMHPKRHPAWMDYTLGCDKEGKLTALKAVIVGDTGAYASVGAKVLERSACHATGAYNVPVVDVVSKTVYTNNLPAGAMRGFGVPQVIFAMEGAVDELCARGGFDRWQFRYDNALKDGDMVPSGQILKSGVGVRDTLLAVKDIFAKAKHAGIACGIKNTGIGNGVPDWGKVKIEVVAGPHVIIHHGWTEMGQGVHTIAIQVLCEETGIAPDLVEVLVDTAAGAPSGMTTASRATSILGNAIIDTCKQFKQDLAGKKLDELVGKVYTGEWVCNWTTKHGTHAKEEVTHYSYSYATQVAVLDDNGKLDTFYGAHDAGRIFNPNLFESQIEGAIHMGIGYALSEELPLDKGVPKSTKMRSLGILRARDMPKMVIFGVEVPDRHGPYGAKGVGEVGLVPVAAAVANAYSLFDQKRYYKLPLKRGK
jgi:xanthine dehydrogenase molybdenum-binding subunit